VPVRAETWRPQNLFVEIDGRIQQGFIRGKGWHEPALRDGMKIETDEVHFCAKEWSADHGSSARLALVTVVSRLAFCRLTYFAYWIVRLTAPELVT
jgi:hypothetical protein